jgi:hypothetical protein
MLPEGEHMKTNLEMPERIYLKVPRPAPRAGERWSDEEKLYLFKAVKSGADLFHISDFLGRPYQGVLSKLQQMRCISWEGFHRGHVWIYTKTGRKDPIPRQRDNPITVRPEDAEKLYLICRSIADDTEKDVCPGFLNDRAARTGGDGQ